KGARHGTGPRPYPGHRGEGRGLLPRAAGRGRECGRGVVARHRLPVRAHAATAEAADAAGRRVEGAMTSVLVTGGTGSFGAAFARTLLSGAAVRRIVVFSRDE